VTKHYIRSNEGMEQTMGGFCIPASLALRNALEESGYDDSRVVRGRFQNKGHAWVETQGKIIDIILDQFGGFPSICISDVGDMRYSAVTDDELKNMGLARIGKHPLEGSCQEAILPPYTTFDNFFPLRSAWQTPPPTCGHRRIPVFFRVVSAVRAPHQTPIRIKAP